MKRMLWFLPIVLLAACASTSVTPDLGNLQEANDVVTAGTNAVNTAAGQVNEVVSAGEIINNNSLEWWQWIIVGSFIPYPWVILSEMLKALTSPFLGLFSAIRGLWK